MPVALRPLQPGPPQLQVQGDLRQRNLRGNLRQGGGELPKVQGEVSEVIDVLVV